jgi:glycosyltransferase involved in cell wall biosynthesis
MARIALVHDVARVAETQAEILRSAGHEVDHVRLPDFGPNWPWWLKAITAPIRLLLYLPAIARLRREPYDVIHIHWVPRGIVGLLTGKPFAIQAHGSDLHMHVNTPVLFWLCRRVLERARVIFYVTPNLEEFIHRFDGKAFYLPNPIAVNALARSIVAPREVRRVAIFMRLDPVKGVDRVFPASERLAGMGLQLTAVRWGPLTDDFMVRYGSYVDFVEPVAHDHIGDFLAGFDLVIGQMEQGALGLSELEAMAAGRPLITGIDRAMYPGDKPPVVSSYSADELVEQIERLRHDSRRLENLSREGAAWVRRNHGFQRHLRLLEEAYFGAAARLSDVPMAM